MKKISKLFNLICVSTIFVFNLSQANCEEMAKLSYDSLLKLHETMSKTFPKDIPNYLHLFSINPNVKSEDIILHLVAGEKSIKISIDERGYIDLPIRKDLVGTGAYVVTNQPKGSMALRVEIKQQIPLRNKKIRYKDLVSPLLAVNSSKEIAKEIPETIGVRFLETLNLSLEEEGQKPVIIKVGFKKPIEIIPNKDGKITIPFDKELLQKNPIVEFPTDKVFFTNPWQ